MYLFSDLPWRQKCPLSRIAVSLRQIILLLPPLPKEWITSDIHHHAMRIFSLPFQYFLE
jgi:hypothetical protein